MAKYIITSDGKIQVCTERVSLFDVDEKFEEAARYIISEGKGSASLLQRRLEVGYARAARILDQLEQAGILGAAEGNKPRDVIIDSFDEFIKSDGKDDGPEEVFPEDIKKEWSSKEISDPVLSNLQEESLGVEGITIPVGMEKKRLVSASLDNLGHIYIFNSPMCNSIGLLKSQLEFLTNTYSPEKLKLIICDDTKYSFAFFDPPHLLTPVVTDYLKIDNALGWLISELERRLRVKQEMDTESDSKILCVINCVSGNIGYEENIFRSIEKLVNMGHLVGIHLIVCAPLTSKKLSQILSTIPTKIIFKTFSINQANLLGTDDAFDLTSGNEFVFVPAYGKVEKLTTV